MNGYEAKTLHNSPVSLGWKQEKKKQSLFDNSNFGIMHEETPIKEAHAMSNGAGNQFADLSIRSMTDTSSLSDVATIIDTTAKPSTRALPQSCYPTKDAILYHPEARMPERLINPKSEDWEVKPDVGSEGAAVKDGYWKLYKHSKVRLLWRVLWNITLMLLCATALGVDLVDKLIPVPSDTGIVARRPAQFLVRGSKPDVHADNFHSKLKESQLLAFDALELATLVMGSCVALQDGDKTVEHILESQGEMPRDTWIHFLFDQTQQIPSILGPLGRAIAKADGTKTGFSISEQAYSLLRDIRHFSQAHAKRVQKTEVEILALNRAKDIIGLLSPFFCRQKTSKTVTEHALLKKREILSEFYLETRQDVWKLLADLQEKDTSLQESFNLNAKIMRHGPLQRSIRWKSRLKFLTGWWYQSVWPRIQNLIRAPVESQNERNVLFPHPQSLLESQMEDVKYLTDDISTCDASLQQLQQVLRRLYMSLEVDIRFTALSDTNLDRHDGHTVTTSSRTLDDIPLLRPLAAVEASVSEWELVLQS